MSGRSTDGARPAQIHMYLECPHCGHIPKPSGTLLVLPGPDDDPSCIHTRCPCDQCGCEDAMLYMEREFLPVQ